MTRLLAGVVLLAPLTAGLQAEPRSGKELVDFHCQSCHDASVYTRKDRFIKSMPALKTQIQRCATTLDLSWFDEEINSVAGYLNNTYYHFGQ